MIKTATVNGKKYRIDTDHRIMFGYKCATVDRLISKKATGALANIFADMGHPIDYNEGIPISRDEQADVVMALGYKFSKAKAWKNLFEYCKNYKRGQTLDNSESTQ